MSWPEAFATRYEEWPAEMTADIPFYVEFVRQADGPLVELVIGNGRVAIPVAQATGQRVTGIESSATINVKELKAVTGQPVCRVTWRTVGAGSAGPG
jgi:hypothetical protein